MKRTLTQIKRSLRWPFVFSDEMKVVLVFAIVLCSEPLADLLEKVL